MLKMDGKFTPGPWVIEKIGEAYYVAAPDSEEYKSELNSSICHVYINGNLQKCEANAQMLAAAPDLYAACEAQCKECPWSGGRGDCTKCPTYAALRKARGEE